MDEKIIKKCIEARHKLHQLAELSNDEIQTKIFLMEFLKKNSCLEIHDEGKWFYDNIGYHRVLADGFMLFTNLKKEVLELLSEVKLTQCQWQKLLMWYINLLQMA